VNLPPGDAGEGVVRTAGLQGRPAILEDIDGLGLHDPICILGHLAARMAKAARRPSLREVLTSLACGGADGCAFWEEAAGGDTCRRPTHDVMEIG
jgi:hypothetical protein